MDALTDNRVVTQIGRRLLSPAGALLAIILAAAVIRAVFLVQFYRAGLEDLLPLDMRFYREIATQLASGAGMPEGGLTFNPLYPIFLATLIRIFGDGLLAARIIQMLSGIITLVLVFHSAKLLAGGGGGSAGAGRTQQTDGNIAGIAAAVLMLLYPQPIIYESGILATALVTMLVAASFAAALSLERSLRGGSGIRIFGRKVRLAAVAGLLGILMGLGIMGRPNTFLLLAPLLLIWLFSAEKTEGRRLKNGLFYAAGLILMLAPASIYNLSSSGSPSPITSHGGINFYVGNMRGANGLYNPPEGMRRDMRGLVEDSRTVAERAAGRKLSDVEASSYWSMRARERIVTDPWGWIRLLGRKFLLFWNAAEYGDMIDAQMLRGDCSVFALLLVRFPLISTLALTGTILIIPLSRSRWIYLIFLSTSLAAIVLFYFNTRYRMPSIPVLAASAGWLVAWLLGKISQRRWKEVGAAALTGAVLFALVTGKEMVVVNRSALYTFLGNNYMYSGEYEKAMEAFGTALRLEPERTEARINFARILRKTGDSQRALQYYAKAWETEPDFPRLALEYGSLLEELGMVEEAKSKYERAYRSGRTFDMVMACKLLSRIAYSEGRVDEAMEWVRRAIEIDPDDEGLKRLLKSLEGP